MVVLKYEKEVNRLLEKYLKDERVRKHFAELQDSAAIHAEHSQRVAAVSLDVALEAKIQELHLRDGKLDGKLTLNPVNCTECGRKLHERRKTCLYCGTPVSPVPRISE